MDILVLGGTQLTGLHLVPRLLSKGYRVTLLTRGNKRPAFLPRVEHIVTDRCADGLRAVAGRRFDAVVDNIAYEPTHIQQVVDSLGDGAGRYVFMRCETHGDDSPPGPRGRCRPQPTSARLS